MCLLGLDNILEIHFQKLINSNLLDFAIRSFPIMKNNRKTSLNHVYLRK